MKNLLFLTTFVLCIGFFSSCSDREEYATLETSSPSLLFSSIGETKEITITSSGKWAITGMDGSITVTPASGSGKQTVSVTMPANTTGQEIQKTLKIETVSATNYATKPVAVTQEAQSLPTLELSPGELFFDNVLTTKTFELVSNGEWIIEGATGNVSVDPTSGNGNQTVTVTTGQNTTAESIVTTLIAKVTGVAGKSVKVTQFATGVRIIDLTAAAGTLEAELNADPTLKTATGIAILGDMNGDDFKALSNIEATYLNLANTTATVLPENTFESIPQLNALILPSGLITIETSAIDGCESLTSIKIPSSVTTIESYAFYTCVSLWRVEFEQPSSLNVIEHSAFTNCPALTSIIIPPLVSVIEDNTLFDCVALTSVDLPAGVTTIKEGAFYGCIALTEVICRATEPPTLEGDEVFGDIKPIEAKLKVPAASVPAYLADPLWAEYFAAENISAI